MKLDTPIRRDAIRFVCISDIHSKSLNPKLIPNGDVLLVAGNFTSCGSPEEIAAFTNLLGRLPHVQKVVIAGNREMTFDPSFQRPDKNEKVLKTPQEDSLRIRLQECLAKEEIQDPRRLLKNCIYLEDQLIDVFGVTIYGTPWQPLFNNWAFNLPRGQKLLDKWNQIPIGVDILMTHTPPLGHGDLQLDGNRWGCVELFNSVSRRIRPKYHVFGHIREGYGCTTDGYTKFINASICDVKMQPVNEAVIFDIPLPMGASKDAPTRYSIETFRSRSQTFS